VGGWIGGWAGQPLKSLSWWLLRHFRLPKWCQMARFACFNPWKYLRRCWQPRQGYYTGHMLGSGWFGWDECQWCHTPWWWWCCWWWLLLLLATCAKICKSQNLSFKQTEAQFSSVQFGLVRFRWVGLEFEVKLRPAGSPVGVLIVQSMIFYPKAIANDWRDWRNSDA